MTLDWTARGVEQPWGGLQNPVLGQTIQESTICESAGLTPSLFGCKCKSLALPIGNGMLT